MFPVVSFILALLDFQDGDFEKRADAWLTNVNSERNKCFKQRSTMK